jgi:hypothetical protein
MPVLTAETLDQACHALPEAGSAATRPGDRVDVRSDHHYVSAGAGRSPAVAG